MSFPLFWGKSRFPPNKLFITLTGRAGVVAQLVEQSLPTPMVCSSNPVIGKNLY